MNLIGTDISFYQDNPDTPQVVDFEQMRSAGASFVIIRAGQNTWIDKKVKDHWKRSKGVLPRGSYWFYDDRSKPGEQVKLWREALGDSLPECGVWMDFEKLYGGAYGREAHFKDFAEGVKDAFPNHVEVGVYTAFYWWETNVKDFSYWHQYASWIANYGVARPLVPRPWKQDEWTFWQYTDKGDGKKFGVESAGIDLNYFNGDAAKFEKTFGSVPVIEPKPEPSGGVLVLEGKTYDVIERQT